MKEKCVNTFSHCHNHNRKCKVSHFDNLYQRENRFALFISNILGKFL